MLFFVIYRFRDLAQNVLLAVRLTSLRSLHELSNALTMIHRLVNTLSPTVKSRLAGFYKSTSLFLTGSSFHLFSSRAYYMSAV